MTSPLRLLVLPIGGRETASSRLRVHDLLVAASDRIDADVLVTGMSADPSDYNALYVQKNARPHALELARRFTDAGVPLVYDIDDDFGCWPGMDEPAMCGLASLITVDSPARAQALRAEGFANVEVVPCMIDLATDPARDRAMRYEGPVRRVATFGNHGSVVAARDWLRQVAARRTIVAIGPVGTQLHDGVHVTPFRLGTFIDQLVAAEVLMVAHDPVPGALKDNNRLVLGMSLGKPTLCSPSPAYVETLAGVGLEWLVCAPFEVEDRLRALDDPDLRAHIGESLRRAAWHHYAPSRCAELFVALVRSVANLPKPA